MFFIDLEDPDQKWIGLRVINQIFLLGLTVFDRFLFFMDPDPIRFFYLVSFGVLFSDVRGKW